MKKFSRAAYKAAEAHMQVSKLINNYQRYGHLAVDLDPLGLAKTARPVELAISKHLGSPDVDRPFLLPPATHIGEEQWLPLREIISRLESSYCEDIGVEFDHIEKTEQREWIQRRFELPANHLKLSANEKRELLKSLIRVTAFETFLAKKWPNEKRFGIEGCEVLVPALQRLIARSRQLSDVDSVSIGMAHRGRLNVIANVCCKPLADIFTLFMDLPLRGEGAADVKYHIGCCVDERSSGGLKTALLSNPSHLEFNPVLRGKVLAEMVRTGDTRGSKHLALIIHGDGAFSGQGVVMESLQLCALPHYNVGGSVHVMVNNQIGFTTDPGDLRSTRYSTDMVKMLPDCPILHVNANKPEAVIHACDIAADWRSAFQRDVMVDVVGYRLHGHNELDEPAFTQSQMYRRIREMPSIAELYKQHLIKESTVDENYVESETAHYEGTLTQAYEEAQQRKARCVSEWMAIPSKDFNEDRVNSRSSGVGRDVIERVGECFSTIPRGFTVHRGVERVLKGRREMLQAGSFDWSIGEALAFGSLLLEGVHVRLSGQDTQRGTFSHRHHILHDTREEVKTYCQLSHIAKDQALYTVCNSLLSEFAALGFELGYSMVNRNSLVVWEAQFGDFANNAQCIIDQYIAAGESKWGIQTGIVLLLPHGYEGMGSEHSSARLERFLQLSGEGESQCFEDDVARLQRANLIVANCSTPANLFHLLRRQVLLPFRKPAVLMTPKSLLRHPRVRSAVEEVLPGTSFKHVIEESGAAAGDPRAVKRLVFCSGKTYYDITEARDKSARSGEIAVARIEQLTPFPFEQVQRECAKYPEAELVWAQEEPANMGAWSFVRPRLTAISEGDSRRSTRSEESPSTTAGLPVRRQQSGVRGVTTSNKSTTCGACCPSELSPCSRLLGSE